MVVAEDIVIEENSMFQLNMFCWGILLNCYRFILMLNSSLIFFLLMWYSDLNTDSLQIH